MIPATFELTKMRISHLFTRRGRNPAVNQVVVHVPAGDAFFSYGTFIAFSPARRDLNNPVVLGPDWNYSNTTGRYRNQFLGEGLADTRRKIGSGEYRLLAREEP